MVILSMKLSSYRYFSNNGKFIKIYKNPLLSIGCYVRHGRSTPADTLLATAFCTTVHVLVLQHLKEAALQTGIRRENQNANKNICSIPGAHRLLLFGVLRAFECHFDQSVIYSECPWNPISSRFFTFEIDEEKKHLLFSFPQLFHHSLMRQVYLTALFSLTSLTVVLTPYNILLVSYRSHCQLTFREP